MFLQPSSFQPALKPMNIWYSAPNTGGNCLCTTLGRCKETAAFEERGSSPTLQPVPIHHTADGPSPRLCTEHLKVWATMKLHWQNHYKPSYSFKLAFKWTPEKIWRNWYGTMSCFWKVVVLFPIWSASLWKGSSVYPHWVAQSCVSVSESPVFFIRHLTFQGLRIKICLPGGVREKDCMKNRRKENQSVQLLSHMQGTFATADQINLNKYFHHYSIGGSSGILQNALSFDKLDY